MKIVSWNLLRTVGATLDDVVDLIERERPDLMLMQEVTHPFATLCDRVGGSYANVHLSHGQRLNRRQLREVAQRLPARGAVLGDFNLVGPVLLPGFRDVGPRWPTHRMGKVVPLRIDRCLVRGLSCEGARVLPRRGSDHRPISVHLAPDQGGEPAAVRYRAAAVSATRREAGREGSAP